MATQQKVWIDGRGQEVPSSYVSKYDKARDRAVRRVVAGAQRLRGQIEAFMADAVATMDGLAGIKEDLGKRGNFSARSFDALLQVSIRQQWHIRLDERVAKARELMLGYANRELERWMSCSIIFMATCNSSISSPVHRAGSASAWRCPIRSVSAGRSAAWCCASRK